jgi:hypothetical protein
VLLPGTTYDPCSLAAGVGVAAVVAMPDATFGNDMRGSVSLDLQGIEVSACVLVANTISVQFQNGTAAALDLASGTIRGSVEKA